MPNAAVAKIVDTCNYVFMWNSVGKYPEQYDFMTLFNLDLMFFIISYESHLLTPLNSSC